MKTKTVKEKNCAWQASQGAIESNQLLVAGLVVIIVISAVIIGSVLYAWKKQATIGKNWAYENNIANLQTQINSLKKQIAQNKAENTGTATSQETPAALSSSEAFEKALNDKNFAKVESLMAARIYYVIDASDCCGDITRKETVGNLQNYIHGVKSFNFDQNQQVVRQMKVNLASTFSKYTIGIADNQMVLSYHLDQQGKVDDLMLSASHLMYDLE